MSESRSLNTVPSHLLLPDVVVLSLIFAGTFVGARSAYNRYLKQLKKVTEIPSSVFRRRWLYGKVTSVGDGDNFHFFHTPGGLLGGWGWLREVPVLQRLEVKDITSSPTRRLKPLYRRILERLFGKHTLESAWSNHFLSLQVPYKNRRNLSTLSIRLCGVDAPERAHFGNPAQPFSDEALNWLRYTILGRNLWIKPLSMDQYGRCVAKVVYWSWLGYKDLSLEMVKRGLAVVYESKSSAEFDGSEKKYRKHEKVAKLQRRGLWSQKKIETPGEYKKNNR